MQGIILTGGQGTRLRPLTNTTNKHLLDVCGKPMVHYSLSILASAEVDDITLVSNRHHLDQFKDVLKDGIARDSAILRFVAQHDKPGIAGSILMMPVEKRRGPYMVVLGDNIIGGSALEYRREFDRDPNSALMLLSEVTSPEAFGVAHIENNRLKAVEEKPEGQDSHWAITGIYFFPPDLFEAAAGVTPSARGEYEVTDILNWYHSRGRLRFRMLDCWWIDAGTHESLAEVKKRLCGEETDSVR